VAVRANRKPPSAASPQSGPLSQLRRQGGQVMAPPLRELRRPGGAAGAQENLRITIPPASIPHPPAWSAVKATLASGVAPLAISTVLSCRAGLHDKLHRRQSTSTSDVAVN